MNDYNILPFSNDVQFIPKDNPTGNGIYPVEYWQVTEENINLSTSSSAGSFTPITEGLINIIEITGPPSLISPSEGTAATFSVNAIVTNTDLIPTYQWQKLESNGVNWTVVSGATSPSFTTGNLSFANDYLDQYRCIVTSDSNIINSPATSGSVVLNIRRLITITSQPVSPGTLFGGESITLNVAGTITSDVINYQWQRKDFESSEFVAISGATSSSYTKLTVFPDDVLDTFRCVLSNPYADPKITNQIVLDIIGTDLKVTPAVSGVTFWKFGLHGPLILDPANADTYQIECLSADKDIRTDMWGQGSCNARAGYSSGIVPMVVGSGYTVKLNAGGGAAGLTDSGRFSNAGGGYAGLFSSQTISQQNALLIAGGAGGAGLNTAACGSSEVNQSYTISVPYQGTCYNNYYNYGTINHLRDRFANTDISLTWDGTISNVITTGNESRSYYVFFNTSFQDTNYNLNIYNVSSCTAGLGACPGFSYNIDYKGSSFFIITFTRNDENVSSYVNYFSVNAYASYPYSCTQYQNQTVSYVGQSPTIGGAGGGIPASNGASSSNSIITATGGLGGTQSAGGEGGTTSSAGTTNGSAGSALQGGSGGANSGSYAAAGGGGGGGGYWGGGGGAGGYDGGNVSQSSGIGPQPGGAGGGGAGFVSAMVSGTTSGFVSTVSGVTRGNAGDVNQNSKVIFTYASITITSQPTLNIVYSIGQTATMTVVATVTLGIISYQWQKKLVGGDWEDISGQTSNSYTTPTITTQNSTGDAANTKYRCKLSARFAITIYTNELILNFDNDILFTNPGISTFNVPAQISSITFKVWGSGGAGVGEGCGGPYSGGSGGYVQGRLNVSSTDIISIFVGQTGQGSTGGLAGYGAGQGGQFSYVKRGNDFAIAGSGGGAGQAGNGGYGGGNASGGAGTSSTISAYIGQGGTQSSGGTGGSGFAGADAGGTGTAYPNGGGGAAGGTGVNQGNRGGGGGAGYFGGGGGGGGNFDNTNCQSGGGGGGSGIISGSWTNTVSYNGQTGTSGGRSAVNSGDPNYFAGYGGSNQDGLVVLSWAPIYSISSSNSSVNEGSSVTITVTTTNVFNGTTLYWQSGSSTIGTSTNISPYQGSVTINNNTATFNIAAIADSTTEGTQSFYVNLYKESAYTTLLSSTSVITINDTSQTPPAPSGTFTASPTSINSGSSSTLSWSISNATSVSINQGVGSVTSNSSTTVSPTSTTTYTLSASGPGGSLSLQRTVTVQALPTVNGTFITTTGPTGWDWFDVGVTRTFAEVSNNVAFTYSVTFSGGSFDSFNGNPPTGTFGGTQFGGALGRALLALPNPHSSGTINVIISAPGYTSYTYSMNISST